MESTLSILLLIFELRIGVFGGGLTWLLRELCLAGNSGSTAILSFCLLDLEAEEENVANDDHGDVGVERDGHRELLGIFL